jgi:hypothetical protein
VAVTAVAVALMAEVVRTVERAEGWEKRRRPAAAHGADADR